MPPPILEHIRMAHAIVGAIVATTKKSTYTPGYPFQALCLNEEAANLLCFC